LNDIIKKHKSIAATLGLFVLLFTGLTLLSFLNYPLFHILAEFAGIIIAAGIFMVAWATKRITDNDYLLFLAFAYTAVAGLDMMHSLTYKGVGIFQNITADIPTQLWIAARYTESLALLIAPLFLTRKLPKKVIAVFFALLTAGLIILIIPLRWFPTCFVEGSGLTLFKTISEYIICGILIAGIFHLRKNRSSMDRRLYRLLTLSIFLSAFAELAFTFYVSVYGIANLIGHLLKIASFYLIYKGLIENILKNPYALLFKKLADQKDELRIQNETLKTEIDHREDTEQKLRGIIDSLKQDKESVDTELEETKNARFELIRKMSDNAMRKADKAQEYSKLLKTTRQLQEENTVLMEQLSYYVRLFEQTKEDLSNIITDSPEILENIGLDET